MVMSGGTVQQSGPVLEVLNRPANEEVARIVGIETLQPGRVVGVSNGLATVAVGSATVLALSPATPAQQVLVAIRAEDVVLTEGPQSISSARNRLPGLVKTIHSELNMTCVELDCGFALKALVTRQAVEELRLEPGAAVVAWVKAPHVHLIHSSEQGT